MNQKPFYKTSEFWTMIATQGWALAVANISPETQAFVVGGVAAAYKLTRGMAKSGK